MLWTRAQAPTTGEGVGSNRNATEVEVVAGDPSIDFRTRASRAFVQKGRGAEKEKQGGKELGPTLEVQEEEESSQHGEKPGERMSKTRRK